MLMTEYTYTITGDQSGHTIVLTQTSSGRTKTFFQTGAGSDRGLVSHMNSLTDSQCEQWFNVGRPDKKKKKEAPPDLIMKEQP